MAAVASTAAFIFAGRPCNGPRDSLNGNRIYERTKILQRLRGMYVLEKRAFGLIYGEAERNAIATMIDIDPISRTPADALNDPALASCDVIVSGWGGPKLNAEFLSKAPKLQALFYGAGSVGGVLTDAAWSRGVQVTSAYAANARPVAEYTLAMILLALKNIFRASSGIRVNGAYPGNVRVAGCFGSTVGLVSLSMIGRGVATLLRQFDMRVLAYDPFVKGDEAASLGVELVSLEELFRRSDVVSLHTPLLKETNGMITGSLLESMPDGATFINTARGAVVKESELIDVLRRRADLYAILDVTAPEPPVPGSPLYSLPNVLLTPHLAGSQDQECRRMGQYMVDELRRYLKGEPLTWAVTRESVAFSSHRPS